MLNWLSMVSCSDREFEGLHNELMNCSGSYIFDDVKMPQTCHNKVCTIQFNYYSPSRISLICAQAPINYVGSDEHIERWLTNGSEEFNSFDSLKEFLKSFRNDRVSTPPIDNYPECLDEPVVNIPERPQVRYDFDAITVPDSNKRYLEIDKDKLVLDLSNEIFGQDESIKKISHLVCNHLGTKNRTRPLSIFLYGPTGVGKTQTIKKLTAMINKQIPADKSFALKIVDCSQFQENHDISKLIGAPPGYIGYDEPGAFAILEDNPHVIFVFDEIEKAANNVTETIMQALDTGVQDTNGKTLSDGRTYYDLSQSIIFFTSNIVLEEKKKPLGFGNVDTAPPVSSVIGSDDYSIARLIQEETRKAKPLLVETGRFRKEVIGRMKAIFKFNTISDEAVKRIAPKCISDLAAENHSLYVTDIETPILQEFINATAKDVKEFGVRVFRNEAENFFADAFIQFAKIHNDYEFVTVSGTLDNVIIKETQDCT
ncbi:MAG: ATP-dependent Clp protease ATP-binding subunit [Eubacterium sp.]|nr:ATP-dependent Clp protease ATP-binding subunit [Eubacterium sp.]